VHKAAQGSFENPPDVSTMDPEKGELELSLNLSGLVFLLKENSPEGCNKSQTLSKIILKMFNNS
jgi:hypothetical protein